jgi:hypothetical protein
VFAERTNDMPIKPVAEMKDEELRYEEARIDETLCVAWGTGLRSELMRRRLVVRAELGRRKELTNGDDQG